MTDQELFKAVTVRLCGTLDLAGGLEKVFPLLRVVLPLDEIRLNTLDTEMHAVKTVAVVDENGKQDLLSNPLVLPLPKEAETELKGDELEDIRIVDRINQDRATAAIRSEFFATVPESSMLIMRLLLDNQRQGVLLLRAEGEGRYTEGHKKIMAELNEPFGIALSNALAHRQISQLKDTLAEENRKLSATTRDVIGASFGLSSVMDLVGRVAPLDTTVLLLGETGVGKEVIADAIHQASPRRQGPIIKLNCGAIPDTLIDSELFGHEKGAFTGAISEKKGRFEQALGGTLFLDEIGELPAGAQLRLLRVLQSKTFERVGGKIPVKTDARIIAATHRDLESMVQQGSFRQDLWFRINVFPVHIPPLRARKQDIPALASHLIERKSREMGIYPPPALSDGAMNRLIHHHWPGNVRELQNMIEREIILNRNGPLRFDWIEQGERKNEIRDQSAVPPEPLDSVIAAHIRRTLKYTKGKVGGPGGAAEILRVNASTLRHRMRTLRIPYGRK